MDFQVLAQSYLCHCLEKKRLTKKSLVRYSYLLNVFRDFLMIENKINSEMMVSYLNGITPEEVFRSLNYYIDNSRIVGSKPVKSEETARLYVSVVKEFFRYLNMENFVQSTALIQSFGLRDDDVNSFACKHNETLEHLYQTGKITERSEDKIPTDEEIEEILECCNEFLSLTEIERLPNKKNAYNKFVKALAIKLILLTGIKVTPTIKALCKGDLNLNEGVLKIRNYTIHLPFYLRLQFSDYMKICKCQSDDDALFVLYNGKPVKDANELSTIFSYRTNNSSITSLAKYAILEMIDAGLDKDTVLEFTGYGNDVYAACKEIAELGAMESRSHRLDQSLKCLPLYDML